MIRQLLDDDTIMTTSVLVVEVRTLDGQLLSSRKPTAEEVALAQSSPDDLEPLVRRELV